MLSEVIQVALSKTVEICNILRLHFNVISSTVKEDDSKKLTGAIWCYKQEYYCRVG